MRPFVSTILSSLVVAIASAQDAPENRWEISAPILRPGPAGSFDEVAVKDPTIVFFDGRWHLFYTARSRTEYTTGYVSAEELTGLQSASRHQLGMIRGKSPYGCAPQVFYYRPQRRWYLIFQNRDANYQPAFSTTTSIARPESWSTPRPLIEKDAQAKWIDFWVICDKANAYLFYTQSHREVVVRSTSLADFPTNWGPAQVVLDGVHEAVHIYRVKDRDEFHMIYELNIGGIRSFGLAVADHLAGPWRKVTDRYATGEQLTPAADTATWPEMVSHGEVLRCGHDEQMGYEPNGCRWLIQGLLTEEMTGPYPSLPWRLGVMRKIRTQESSSGFRQR